MKRRHSYRRSAKSRRRNYINRRLLPFVIGSLPMIKSVLIFAGAILVSFLALPLYWEFIAGPLPHGIAYVTGFILRLFGTAAQVTGTLIVAPVFTLEVVSACTGIFAYIIFSAAVLAYPCRLREKAMGVALGIPAIFVINIIRIVSLFYIGAFLPQLFEAAHLLFWQSLMIASAVLIWLFWAQRLTHVRK